MSSQWSVVRGQLFSRQAFVARVNLLATDH